MEEIKPSLFERRLIVSVVDDDAAMRAALTDLLDSAGCESMAFDSGEHFFASGAAERSAVIITDIQMAEISGLDLLAKLKENQYSDVPVIVITALTDERLERRANAQGCYAFLRKPFDPDKLLCHVRDAVARS
ncbi:response regulator transcription factor [Neorhizobium sp. T6_25]|jgi:FixJ family two-component response regulator|uniref:response regulator transcription factor n=1 Tax=Neorhizobium sp. T6_25 TaxID=2093833 RepID=UPI000CF8B1DA|nr:response regulator [Neorhizobium sp. T6_25]